MLDPDKVPEGGRTKVYYHAFNRLSWRPGMTPFEDNEVKAENGIVNGGQRNSFMERCMLSSVRFTEPCCLIKWRPGITPFEANDIKPENGIDKRSSFVEQSRLVEVSHQQLAEVSGQRSSFVEQAMLSEVSNWH